MNKSFPALILLSLLFLLSSCKFQKLLKNGTVDEKYEAAMKMYEKKDYSRTLQLFDQLAGAMRATDKAQQLAFRYAYCYYYMADFTMAAYYFKRFSTTYPNTPEAEECMFMSAYCNYMLSPEYSLDQSTTYEALKELQLFTNTYPKSKRVSECNDLMDELRLKLEMKDYKIARLFYRMEDYSAATQCFANLMKDYPDSPHREEVLFLAVKANFRYAKESISEKQKERYSKTVTSYNDFAALYPQSNYIREARDMCDKAKKELESITLREQNNQERVRFKYN